MQMYEIQIYSNIINRIDWFKFKYLCDRMNVITSLLYCQTANVI